MVEKSRRLKYIVIGIVVIFIFAGVLYSVYHTTDPSLKLNGTFHMSPDQIMMKTFNVTSSGATFNIVAKGPINATGYFALLVTASDYTN